MTPRKEEAFLAAQNFEEASRAFGQLSFQIFLLLDANAHDHNRHVQLFEDKGFSRCCIAGTQQVCRGKQAEIEAFIKLRIRIRRIETIGQMPERHIGHIMAAHGICGTFANEIIAGIGDFLNLIDHIFLGANGLKIWAVFDTRP